MARRPWLVAVALAGIFCFTGLSNHPLRAPDEPRVAGIAWEMQHGAGAPIPRLGGEPFLEHPPLYYCVLGVVLRALGNGDGVARLPSALAAFFTLLLVFDLGQRIASPLAGLSALLALVELRGFFRYSHRVLVDPMLALFVLLGFYAYVRAVWGPAGRGIGSERGRAGGRDVEVSAAGIFGIYLAASLAFYVKGLVGILAIAGPIAADVLLFRRFRVLRSAGHLAGLPLLLAVCASWPALLHAHGGDAALREFLLQNGLYRLAPGAAVGVYRGGHEQPFWYYLENLPWQLTWWITLVPGVAAWVRRAAFPPAWNVAAIRFLGLVFPLGMLLLSIPGTKRGLYLLPFTPPLAVALGAWVAAMRLPDAGRSGVERGVAWLSARLVDGTLRPVAALARRLFAPGSRIGGAGATWEERLREDRSNVPHGPCHAPLRIAAIAFAVSVAWNVFGYRLSDHGRDLGPTSRRIAAAVGDAPLADYSLPEAMRGALPFYTGRIALNLRSEEDLGRYLREHPGGMLLSISPPPEELREGFGELLSPRETWGGFQADYTLYEILAEPRDRIGLRAPGAPEE